MSTPECKGCGASTTAGQNFCRKCGLPVGSYGVDEIDEADWHYIEFPDDSWVDNLQEVDDVAKLAIPENFKEVSLEHLRGRVVQAIWIRTHGDDPFDARRTDELEPAAETETADDTVKVPVGQWVPARAVLASSAGTAYRWHILWSRGLVSHVSLTSNESKRLSGILEGAGYQLELCDCSKVAYIPSKGSPEFLRKA